MILIQDLLDILKTKLVILLIYRFGAQVNQERPVPPNCSTPFYENRYQIIVNAAEVCFVPKRSMVFGTGCAEPMRNLLIDVLCFPLLKQK